MSRRRRRNDALILGYHNVLPTGLSAAGDASLHLPAERFIEHLNLLAETHDVVSLQSVLEGNGRTARRPRVAITFDDAYWGALTIAVPELVRRGMPATIFVAPGILGRHPWWDQVAEPQLAAVPAAERELALREFGGDNEAILSNPRFPKRSAPDAQLRIGTESEVLSAAALPGITIGSHTWSHRNMAVYDGPATADELRRPMDWLRERFTTFIPVVSYPYGLFSPTTLRVAADLGYRAGLRIDGGWVGSSNRDDVFALPRYNVPAGLSSDGFSIRLAGLLERA